jgi:hypothetical protein
MVAIMVMVAILIMVMVRSQLWSWYDLNYGGYLIMKAGSRPRRGFERGGIASFAIFAILFFIASILQQNLPCEPLFF